jgi:hypothetical protein
VAVAADEARAKTVIADRGVTAQVDRGVMGRVDHGVRGRVDHDATLATKNADEAKSDPSLPASPSPANSIPTTPSSKCWAKRCAKVR